MHPLAFYLLLFPLTAQANLYKCTDSAGKVTYTNSACAKVGLREAKVIPPPPPPALNPASKASQTAAAAEEALDEAAGKTAKASKKKEATALELMKTHENNDRKCTRLNEDLGKTMDEIDAARRQGYTPQQEADWNDKLRKLQAEKNRLGCF